MLEKWKKAVIHLEAATDSVDSDHYAEKIKELSKLLGEQKITREQYDLAISSGSRDIRYHGTAIFLAHEGRRYLLTARHVVWDELRAERELEWVARLANAGNPHQRQQFLDHMLQAVDSKIFGIFFRVSSLDEILSQSPSKTPLMNLGVGPVKYHSYTFSDPKLDLAVISLDRNHTDFAEDLLNRGYAPISLDDIADGPDIEGQEIAAIGFPSATALIGYTGSDNTWGSNIYSLPISSFGRVSMLHPELDYFWADISIYPGNSGGAVIANNRLVGIVSAQAILPIDSAPDVSTRIPFGKIIKAGYLRQLLEVQIAKDLL